MAAWSTIKPQETLSRPLVSPLGFITGPGTVQGGTVGLIPAHG